MTRFRQSLRARLHMIRRRGLPYAAYRARLAAVRVTRYRSVCNKLAGLDVSRGASLLVAGLGLVAAAAAAVTRARVVAARLLLLTGAWVGATIVNQQRRTHRRLTIARAQTSRKPLASTAFVPWTTWPISRSMRTEVERRLSIDDGQTKEVVIGRVDLVGRGFSPLGRLEGVQNVDPSELREGERFTQHLVVVEDHVLLRKDFRGLRRDFASEWRVLAALQESTHAPAIYRADEEALKLYVEFVPRDSEPTTSACLRAMEEELDRVHARGVTGFDVSRQNVAYDSDADRARFLSYEGARFHGSTSTTLFSVARDRDRERFNASNHGDVVTEQTAKALLEGLTSRANDEDESRDWYGAIDFGGGLSVGSTWSTDAGTGRWDYLNGPVLAPLVPGKRVLDLGSNCGVMPLMMLRAGASEVIGLERSPDHVEASRVVHRLFEWRDMRKYNFQARRSDIRAILDEDLGKFDIVTALCSLYYLPAQEMASVVRRSATLAPTLVLQGNVETPPRQAALGDRQGVKSSISFLGDLLLANGYSHVAVHAPRGFSRPLLVGSAARARGRTVPIALRTYRPQRHGAFIFERARQRRRRDSRCGNWFVLVTTGRARSYGPSNGG